MATMLAHPHTPQSPPSQSSPSIADHPSSMNTSLTSMTSALPTPAHSINGHSAMDSHDVTMGDDFAHKRKRTNDDAGDQERKKVNLEDPRKMSIQDLHSDVGEKYLLCRTPQITSSPCMTEDLFELFGLAGIASEVARTKPNGEKNALRKTYKGHIKSLGVNGHFDADKKELNDPNGLMAMLSLPETEWYVHNVAGKEIERGFSEEVRPALLRATTMAKGALPPGWDSSVLGDLAMSNVSKKGNNDQTGKNSDAGGLKSGKPSSLTADKMRRNMKKRSHQDISLEGYNETLTEEDGGGYSTGDGDDQSKSKRRKQVHAGQ